MKNLFIILSLLALISCDKQELIKPENTTVSARKSNNKPDKTKPVVNITSPLAGTVIAPGQSFTVTADASDNIGVTKVGFTFNGYYISMTTGPYAATYTMPSFVTEGMTMWVIVEANDASGNSGFHTIWLKVGQP